MYIDWPQIERLPDIDTLIDVGVGKEGTPELYNRFPKAKLILIDPIEEAKNYAKKELSHRDYKFFKYGLEKKKKQKVPLCRGGNRKIYYVEGYISKLRK